MRKLLFVLTSIAGTAFYGCNKSESPAPMADTTALVASPMAPAMEESRNKSVGRMAASEATSAPPTRQFVRSADLRFRCRSVMQATSAIELIVAQNGGFVALNDLHSSLREQHTQPFGTDSILEVSRIDVANTMQLRVPNDRLDTVLIRIVPLVAFLEHRTIRADDVGRELRRAEREHRRMEIAGKRLQNLTQQNPGRIKDLAQVDDEALRREKSAENAADRADDLVEKVQLSTIELSLFQHPETRLDTLQLPLDEIWREPVGKRFVRAARNGWDGAMDLCLWLLSHWVLILVVAGGIWYYNRYRLSRKALRTDKS